jgi:hypothetical protein
MGDQKTSTKALFLKILGDKYPTLKILGFMMDNTGFDYSETDIAVSAGISRTKFFSEWDNLVADELVAFTQDVGQAEKRMLNSRPLASSRSPSQLGFHRPHHHYWPLGSLSLSKSGNAIPKNLFEFWETIK